MKRISILLLLLVSFSSAFSQGKSQLISQFGLSFTDYNQCKYVNIPFVSIAYSHTIIEELQIGIKINVGNLNQFTDLGFYSYNFKDFILDVDYNKILFNRFLIKVGCDFGVEDFFSSEIVKKQDFFPEKSDILTIHTFIAPILSFNYIFKNNLFIGFSYSHKIFFKDKNAPNLLFNIGVRL